VRVCVALRLKKKTTLRSEKLSQDLWRQVAIIISVALFTITGSGASCLSLLTEAGSGAVGGTVRTVTIWNKMYLCHLKKFLSFSTVNRISLSDQE
jgi:hypothetical protein